MTTRFDTSESYLPQLRARAAEVAAERRIAEIELITLGSAVAQTRTVAWSWWVDDDLVFAIDNAGCLPERDKGALRVCGSWQAFLNHVYEYDRIIVSQHASAALDKLGSETCDVSLVLHDHNLLPVRVKMQGVETELGKTVAGLFAAVRGPV